MAAKTFWRCTVCGDVHFGIAGPEICPTCKNKNTYVATSQADAKKAMKI
jgi:rubrerythrin